MNYLNKAFKEIDHAIKYESKAMQDIKIKFWLKRMFQEGQIAGLNWSIELRKKHNEHLGQ